MEIIGARDAADDTSRDGDKRRDKRKRQELDKELETRVGDKRSHSVMSHVCQAAVFLMML